MVPGALARAATLARPATLTLRGAEGAVIKNRFSLLVGSVIFAVLVVRIAIPGTEPGEGGTLQAAALIGGSVGALATVVALRLRLRVPAVHLALLAPLVGAGAAMLIIEDATGRGGAGQPVADVVGRLRTAVESGNLLLEDVVVFAVAFWVIAAFFVHATVAGSPRIAVLAPLVAALAVTVLEPPPTSLSRILLDVGLVAAVLLAAALDERSRPAARFTRPAASPSDRSSAVRQAVATATVLAAAIGVAALLGSAVTDRQIAIAPASQGQTIVYRPFADVHQRLTEVREDELFTIGYGSPADTDEYIRLFTLPSFDGDAFVTGSGGAQTSGSDMIDQTVEITGPLGGTWLPAVNGVRSVVDAQSTIVDGGVRGTARSGMRYRVVSTGPVDVTGDQVLVPPPAPETVRLDGLNRRDEVTRMASAIAGGGSHLDRAVALEAHFRAGTYRLPESPQAGSIGSWLLDADEPLHLTGYCEQFAVGMAVAARAIGIPSRVVVGFAPGKASGSTVVYTGAEAHAWVEVWIDGSGWVMFDPTPRGGVSALGPEYRPADPTAAAPTTTAPGEATATSIVAAAPGQGNHDLPWFLLALLIVLSAFALVAGGATYDRRRRRRLASAGNVTAAWHVVVRRLDDLGRTPAPSATPMEIAEQTGRELEPLATAYTKSTYGGTPIGAAERADAVRSMVATEQALDSDTGLVRRIGVRSGLGRLMRRGRR